MLHIHQHFWKIQKIFEKIVHIGPISLKSLQNSQENCKQIFKNAWVPREIKKKSLDLMYLIGEHPKKRQKCPFLPNPITHNFLDIDPIKIVDIVL